METTPRLVRTLERAEQEAAQLGHDYVGTEHVLLALLADPDGIAGQVLGQVAAADDLRAAVEEIVSSPAYATTAPHPQQA